MPLLQVLTLSIEEVANQTRNFSEISNAIAASSAANGGSTREIFVKAAAGSPQAEIDRHAAAAEKEDEKVEDEKDAAAGRSRHGGRGPRGGKRLRTVSGRRAAVVMGSRRRRGRAGGRRELGVALEETVWAATRWAVEEASRRQERLQVQDPILKTEQKYLRHAKRKITFNFAPQK